MKTNIYELELHEQAESHLWGITRVPGGWIYFDKSKSMMCFVPFNSEFKENPA